MQQEWSMLRAYVDLLKEHHLFVEMNLQGQDYEQVKHLTFHSQDVSEQTLFICKGLNFKEEYLKAAVQMGAICYVSEKKYGLDTKTPYIIVENIRKAMPILASLFYKEPWKKLKTIGIGGTKGKSTTVHYVKNILDAYLTDVGKKKSAVLSSVEVYDGKQRAEAHMTTPEAVELQGHLQNAISQGIEYLTMEVSSQALKYHRVDCIPFEIAVFLNISKDHISPLEHVDFEDYFQSKLLIFKQAKMAVVNLDAKYAPQVLKSASQCQKVVTFSTKDKTADFYADNIVNVGGGFQFVVHSSVYQGTFHLAMPGRFNIENALAAMAAASLLNIDQSYVYEGLKNARVSGRMEVFTSDDDQMTVVIDYAHNKLSFEKVIHALKEEYPDRDLICVFGCAGQKAYNRRMELGTLAGKYSQKVYLVPQDPGEESATQISECIAKYVSVQGCPYEICDSREKGIQAAMEHIERKTIILVAGKGNETRQRYGTQYFSCPSDIAYVQRELTKYNQSIKKQK